MPRRTLLDFFADLATTDGEFLAYDDGYRTWRYRYAEVAARARALADRLDQSGIVKGHAVAIWSENRPEWIVALWGCLQRGVVLVPVDYRASASFVDRVAAITDARLILTGDVVEPSALAPGRLVWTLAEVRHIDVAATRTLAPVEIGPDDTAEIIFTSGATADPKGVV